MTRVVVTGMGVISPVGNNVEAFWEALLAGKSGAGPITQFDHSAHKTHFAAEVKGYDPLAHFDAKEVRRLDRHLQFALVSADEAIKSSGLDLSKTDLDHFGVVMGSGIGGLDVLEEQHRVMMEKGPGRVSPLLVPRMIVNMISGQISIKHGLRGPNTSIVTACTTGTHTIGEAYKTITRGHARLMVAGGSEAAITPLSIAGFENMRALSGRNDSPETASRPFTATRDGFVMGEGAACLVLEEYEHAKARGAKMWCEVVGYGSTADAHHMTAPHPDGEGAVRAMRMALRDAGMEPQEIDHINAHGTSTDLNDKIETAAIKQVFGERAYKIAVNSIKSMTGHLLGAAGSVEGVACALSLTHNVVPPTINHYDPDPLCDLDYTPNTKREMPVNAVMSNSFGFGGHNGVIIFSKVR
ncbi:MAG: beta-ketoacyl-ACP synthase II [Candidatus Sumerlaeia bacterium]|nr:beta-ketoacyl-ACP synthase II [Candidatus Sumerlaeia bacterium]